MSEYDIRQYRPEDRAGFLALYGIVMGDDRGDEWFEWKYEGNPYTDHVPMIVGVADGEIVGARPFFALPVRVDGEREVALQPGDTMVHPEHRREGLFTRMTEQAIERYDGEHPFFFNFPNDQSRPGYLKLGWETVSERESYYRIENPGRVAASRSGRDVLGLVGAAVTPAVQGYYRLRDLTTSVPSEAAVRTESEPPTEELATLYRSAIPDEIHAVRDEQFVEWRFENPDWEYTTYIADDEAGPTAAIVAATSAGSEVTTTKLVDVVPVATAPSPALKGLLARIVTDHPKTDVFAAPPQGFPDPVLRSFGFHSDTTFPLSMVTSRTTHVVRPLIDDRERTGRDVTDPGSWTMTFVEEDTS